MSSGPARLGEIPPDGRWDLTSGMRNSHVDAFEWASPARWDETGSFCITNRYSWKMATAEKIPQILFARVLQRCEIICCLKNWKSRLEYTGINFDAGRSSQVSRLAEAMAKIYNERGGFDLHEICRFPFMQGTFLMIARISKGLQLFQRLAQLSGTRFPHINTCKTLSLKWASPVSRLPHLM